MSAVRETWDLILGCGEVGKSLGDVLGERRKILYHDPPKGIICQILKPDYLHVCIPFIENETFVEETLHALQKFDPFHIVIHSTVPVGTTRLIHDAMLKGIRETGTWSFIAYSPIRGLHPNLSTHIRQFPKWYATFVDGEVDNQITRYFAEAGISMRKAETIESLELMKLLDTLEYGYRIALWQEIGRLTANLPGIHPKAKTMTQIAEWLFEKRKVYDGDRGMAPIMYDGFIGGHCIMPNLELTKDRLTPELYAWLTQSNNLRSGKYLSP